MKRKKRINPISDKKKAILDDEAQQVQEMLERFKGRCMICGERKPLEKNHTRDRKKFIMTCRRCHCPNGVHKYLDDWGVETDMSYEEMRELW